MERIDRIVAHKTFQSHLAYLIQAEKERLFCQHDLSHFLDVARIARILNMQEKLEICVEYIYAAALLHDLGRVEQYKEGIPHEQASAELAGQILSDCGFAAEEVTVITDAIASHRSKQMQEESGLGGILYRADKLSRNCFCCSAADACNWEMTKRNLHILY